VKWLVWIGGGGLALVLLLGVVVFVVGSLLPVRHRVSRSVILNAAPDRLYAVLRDFEHASRWRSDVLRTEMVSSADGRVRFREHGRHGAVTYELVVDEPQRRMVTRIADQGLGYGGSWTYTFLPRDRGTELTIVEQGEVSNPMFRFMSQLVFGQTATIDTYLRALASHLEPSEHRPG
jgi:hypothetical protein